MNLTSIIPAPYRWAIFGLLILACCTITGLKVAGHYLDRIALLNAAATIQNAHTAATNITTKGIAHDAAKTIVAGFAAIDASYPPPRLRKPASSRPLPDAAPVAAITGTDAAPSVSDPQQCNDRDSAHDAYQVIELVKFYTDVSATINR